MPTVGTQLVRRTKRNKPSDIVTVDIPLSTRTIVQKVEANQIPNKLHVPKMRNSTPFDAWIPGIGAFQMTVGKPLCHQRRGC